MSDHPRISLFLMGGTIDSVGRDRLDLAWYPESGLRLANGELLARVPELADVAQVTENPFRRLPSGAIQTEDWLDLARTIQTLLDRDEADGIVVTHGTNTLEETAYFLNLVLKTDRPVVVCGSMRPSNALSNDGDLNLLNAVRVAASPESKGKGVVVVLNDTILAARDVTKTNTYSVQTFQSRDQGPIGHANADGTITYSHAPLKRHTQTSAFDVRTLETLPRVDVIVSYVGADHVFIEAAVAAGAKGIVSAAAGAGRPTPKEEAALTRAREQSLAICISTRTGSGRVIMSPQQKSQGLIGADNLQPWKARLLLALALTKTNDPREIQKIFDTH